MNATMAIETLDAVETSAALVASPAGLIVGKTPEVMADIFNASHNLAVWQRSLDESLGAAVHNYLTAHRYREVRLVLTPEQVPDQLRSDLPDFEGRETLIEDVALLVDMFCCLFDLASAGLRLTVLDKAMCPKFHVDRVICRLVTSYNEVGTDWLPNNRAERAKLGAGSGGLSDAESGLYNRASDIQSLRPGDVALLKGEAWPGNQLGGIVHRSPALAADSKRLILTLDA